MSDLVILRTDDAIDEKAAEEVRAER